MRTRIDLSSRKQAVSALCACIGIVSISSNARAVQDYYIEEVTDYGNGCGSWDLNDVTSSLKWQMDADGYSGSRWVNADSWPQDWWESCSSSFGTGGEDHLWADNARFSIFAGHGGQGYFFVGQPHNGACTTDIGSNMRLGQMNGSHAGYAMYITSCTMNTGFLVSDINFQWLNQQFGYHNSPDVPDEAAGNFYFRTYTQANKDAWMDEMEWSPGYWFAVNSPIAVTHGTDQSNCNSKHNNSMFANGNVFWGGMGGAPTCGNPPPSFWYCYSLRWHGDCL